MIKVKSSSSFEYSFHNADGAPVGTLKMPTYIAVPRNGWAKGVVPKSLKDHVKLEALGRTFIVDYELLSDRAIIPNDRRFFLMEGDREVAVTDALIARKKAWDFNLNGKRYELAKVGGIFSSLRFDLTLDSHKVGEIIETTGFTLWSRSFTINIPEEIDRPVQLFMFFLAANATYR
jgi:hypothetical protein